MCVCCVSQCVQRCLDQLVAEGKLVEKVYGKQKVYVIDQVNEWLARSMMRHWLSLKLYLLLSCVWRVKSHKTMVFLSLSFLMLTVVS